jgi:hypothetical protein
MITAARQDKTRRSVSALIILQEMPRVAIPPLEGMKKKGNFSVTVGCLLMLALQQSQPDELS